MKRISVFTVLLILLLTISCSGNSEPTIVIVPTQTLIPLKDIPIEPKIFSHVDLGLIVGESMDSYPDTWIARGARLGDNNFIQRFYTADRNPAGFVSISLFEDTTKLDSAYEILASNAKGALKSSSVNDIGDKAITFDDGGYAGVVYIKCHALIIVFVKSISSDFISFFSKDLNERVSSFSCR